MGQIPMKELRQRGDELAAYFQNLKDQSVPSFSLYVRQDIGIQEKLDQQLQAGRRLMGQLTGVYVPPSIKSSTKVNVILYLHGDKVRIVKTDFTMKEYWSLSEMPLREGLKSSGQPYVLIAPTLAANADMGFGTLGAGIDGYLDNVLDDLYKLGPPEYDPQTSPTLGDLIIAGHSGGFGPIRSILSNIRKYKGHIKEIWAFDIMYGNTAKFVESAGVPVYAYFNDTAANTLEMARKRISYIYVMDPQEVSTVRGRQVSSRVPHDNLMQKFWLHRCQRIGSNGTNPEDRKLMVKA
ncbi:MAG: hypothetical protein HY820_19470 [Acidobacteria bacterium]|nr:hypothetical protein [Acidobacteriota bacterium]